MIKARGNEFQSNPDNAMGREFTNLLHHWGYQCRNWPYFQNVKIERIHNMAKSGVLSQRIPTSMQSTTHIDAPAHVVQGTPFIDEVPLPHYFGSGIVVNLPKKKWESITADDLERPCGQVIRQWQGCPDHRRVRRIGHGGGAGAGRCGLQAGSGRRKSRRSCRDRG